jgi:hypothetical protein
MKKVFSVHSNWRFQSYSPDMAEETVFELFKKPHELRLAGLPLADDWPQLPVFLSSPDHPPSDFSTAPILGRFSISPRVFEDQVIRGMLESAGELLPMIVTQTGVVWHIFSLLPKSHCLEVVDEANCQRDRYQDVINYAVRQEKLPEGGVFSLPKDILAHAIHDEQLPPEKDFIQWYQLQGYTGLRFEEQTGNPPAQPKGLPKKIQR